jgi:hypothetical protein
VYAPNCTGNIKVANERARAKKEPVPGKRKCNHCGELKDKSEFQVNNPRTGRRRPECKECTRVYNRERYLSVEQSKRLKTLLRFVVCEEDHLEADLSTSAATRHLGLGQLAPWLGGSPVVSQPMPANRYDPTTSVPEGEGRSGGRADQGP